MRSGPSTDSQVLGTLSDGTVVEQIAEDSIGPNYAWRNVRAPDGAEGWVAVDFLQPAP
ncbi:MAG: SH3 domain-containing protein [Chloroflexaceae bacterium]|nr:SH3 domain-containing protein [Chloroflexaceae bacterium]